MKPDRYSRGNADLSAWLMEAIKEKCEREDVLETRRVFDDPCREI